MAEEAACSLCVQKVELILAESRKQDSSYRQNAWWMMQALDYNRLVGPKNPNEQIIFDNRIDSSCFVHNAGSVQYLVELESV